MARFTDIEGIEGLLEEFDLSPKQKISTLLSSLENDQDEDEEDGNVD